VVVEAPSWLRRPSEVALVAVEEEEEPLASFLTQHHREEAARKPCRHQLAWVVEVVEL